MFLLGDAVRVITRKFDASENSTAVLSFDELTRRPLLRRAATGELPLDYTTRVSVKLNDKARSQLEQKMVRTRFRSERSVSFLAQIMHLIAAVDVDIEIIDRIHGDTRKHAGQWLTSPPEAFLEEVCALHDFGYARDIVSTHAGRVRPIVELDGTVVGRAALLIPGSPDDLSCIVSVGGFSAQRHTFERLFYVYEEASMRAGFFGSGSVVGVVIGETQDAARAHSSVTASPEAIARWAKEQDNLIDIDLFTPSRQVEICHALLGLGVESAKLPFGFLGGQFATVEQFRQAIKESDFVDVPIGHSDYRHSLEFRAIDKLTTPYFTSLLHPTVAVVSKSSPTELLTEEERRDIVEEGNRTLTEAQVESLLGGIALRQLSRIATEVWGSKPNFTIERVNLLAGNARAGRLDSWVFRFNKAH